LMSHTTRLARGFACLSAGFARRGCTMSMRNARVGSARRFLSEDSSSRVLDITEHNQVLPRAYCEMSNETLLISSARWNPQALREMLTREVMAVDNVDWYRAQCKVDEISKLNAKGMFWAYAPYQLNILAFGAVALASIPLTYHVDTVKWFNENFVTADEAEPEDLETPLEVGIWAFTWVGPPLDQLSFFMVCLAFARNQILNLGLKTYPCMLTNLRAKRLERAYPQYDPRILRDFAEGYTLFMPKDPLPKPVDPFDPAQAKLTGPTADMGRTLSVPSIEMAKQMPRAYSNMSPEALLLLATFDDVMAIREQLIREIMRVDGVGRNQALERMHQIEVASSEGMQFYSSPYMIGIVISLIAGFVSIPLTYHYDWVMWFNHHFVTTDIPEPKDLETWLEVAKWAWTWMSVPFCQVTFMLLAFTVVRNQMMTLGLNPYSAWIRFRRSDRLRERFPKYNPRLLHEYAVRDRILGGGKAKRSRPVTQGNF